MEYLPCSKNLSIVLESVLIGHDIMMMSLYSTSNLSNDTYERVPTNQHSQQNKLLMHKTVRLEKSLEETKKENTSLQAKVSG